ncbi:MAG: putative nucleic acid-binding protein contains domain [Prosthecobacter sp.]|nr:putative nucleic acid-binding protein contains domain [Prosthecobacter sp.]
MILVDINVLLYAVDAGSSRHALVKPWLTNLLNQPDGIALCWPVISGFIRIGTNPKALQSPMSTEEACGKIDEWLALPRNAARPTYKPALASFLRPAQAHNRDWQFGKRRTPGRPRHSTWLRTRLLRHRLRQIPRPPLDQSATATKRVLKISPFRKLSPAIKSHWLFPKLFLI